MSPGKFPDVQWEEDDKDFGQTKDQDDGAEFASMLEKEPERDARFLVGEKIKGTVAMIPQGTGTDILIA